MGRKDFENNEWIDEGLNIMKSSNKVHAGENQSNMLGNSKKQNIDNNITDNNSEKNNSEENNSGKNNSERNSSKENNLKENNSKENNSEENNSKENDSKANNSEKNNLKENNSKENNSKANNSEENNLKENNSEENNSEEKNNNYVKDILEMIIYFAIVIFAVLLIHHFVGQQVEVSGSSMETTLHDTDHLILEKLSYQFGDPKRFDIIVFRPYSDEKDVYYIKRIIGLPGEKVQIIGSDIYINGELLEEDYGCEKIIDGGIANESIELGEDEYFVLGDNRNNSKDSRDPSIGPIHKSSIMGRAWVRIWPLNDFRVLEHQ